VHAFRHVSEIESRATAKQRLCTQGVPELPDRPGEFGECEFLANGSRIGSKFRVFFVRELQRDPLRTSWPMTYDVMDGKPSGESVPASWTERHVIPKHSVCAGVCSGFPAVLRRRFPIVPRANVDGERRLRWAELARQSRNKSLGEISATRRSVLSSQKLNDRRSLARYLAEREQLLRSTFLFFCGQAHVQVIRFAWF